MNAIAAKRVLGSMNWPGVGVVVALLAAWQLVVISGMLTFDYLPAPTAIFAEAVDLLRSGELIAAGWHTLRTTLLATLIAVVAGAALGLAAGLLATVREYSTTSIDFLRTIPVTALVPAALLVWGPSDMAEIAVAAYAATWPILINTAGGVRGISSRLHDVAEVLHVKRTSWLTKFVIPAAVQSILVGVRLGMVTGLVLAIVAEMLINPKGLGWEIIASQNALQVERLWAYTLAVGLLAYALNLFLIWVVRKAIPGSVGQLEAVGT